ncbi:MAG: hypothetical protein KKF67_01340 [Nanoarchaeota archaeon]|nr:hypothetical protein [Nanoarchaeota archaeon]
MRGSEIRVIRACERYVKENYSNEGFYVGMRYFSDKDLREIEIKQSELEKIFYVQVDMVKGKITEISEGTDKWLVGFLQLNLPHEMLSDVSIVFS